MLKGKRILFLFLFAFGIFLLTQVALPLISYKVWELTLYIQNTPLISSIPSTPQILGVSIRSDGNFPAIVSSSKRSNLPYSTFKVSVPSIKLDNINTLVESNDFEESLAHLPGTALPGEKGNVFITGHSSLLQLYKPTNFKAIFAHLPEVKKGDLIFVEAGGQSYTYQIKGLKVVDPKEVGVINPPDPNGRYLTLMTCVPPGLYLKRLIVLAELQ